MTAGFRITVRNEHDEVVEYCTGDCVLHIDVPQGRYVITVTAEALEPGIKAGPTFGTLQ
jgi:hypothetical protein